MGGIMGSPTNHIPSEIRTPCLTDSTTSRYQKSAEKRPIAFQWFLQVPEDLQEAYAFKQGQYLTFDQDINGEAVRRSYSICAGVGEELRVAIKQVPDGRFSTWANESLKAGRCLEDHGARTAASTRISTPVSPSTTWPLLQVPASRPFCRTSRRFWRTEAGSTFTLVVHQQGPVQRHFQV